jgi:hypothetical protein
MTIEPVDREHARTPADTVTFGEGLILHVSGPDGEGIRVTDSRGWAAAGDLDAGAEHGFGRRHPVAA